jgi:hypothetical protein
VPEPLSAINTWSPFGTTTSLVTDTDCQNCSLGPSQARGRIFLVRTLEGKTYEVCAKCLYIASPFNDPARMPRRIKPDATDDDGNAVETFPCDEGVGEAFTAPDNALYKVGHMYYASDIGCPYCGRVFPKLVASKVGVVRLPRHNMGPT